MCCTRSVVLKTLIRNFQSSWRSTAWVSFSRHRIVNSTSSIKSSGSITPSFTGMVVVGQP